MVRTSVHELLRIRELYRLKEVPRWAPVLKRKESSAEHTYSALILADFFLPRMKQKIDRAKVFELLLYHDVVEIEAGDVGILDRKNHSVKWKKEALAVKKIVKMLPSVHGKRYERLFSEYERGSSIEVRFARAIDRLDAIVHLLGHKKLWKDWTETEIRENNEKRLSEFPEIKQMFEDILIYVKKERFIRS